MVMNVTAALSDRIIETIPAGSVFLELGSGKGTRKLVEHFDVYTVEHDPQYVGSVPGAKYIHAPLRPVPHNVAWKRFPALTEWYDVDVLRRELPKSYAAVLVDGPPNSFRRAGFYVYYSLFDPTAVVFLDDVGRENESRMLRLFAQDLKIPQVTIYDSHQRHSWSMFDPKDGMR